MKEGSIQILEQVIWPLEKVCWESIQGKSFQEQAARNFTRLLYIVALNKYFSYCKLNLNDLQSEFMIIKRDEILLEVREPIMLREVVE